MQGSADTKAGERIDMVVPTGPLLGTDIVGARALVNFRTPIDYPRVLGTHPIAFFGEAHWEPAVINEMAALSGTLRNLGFTHLVFEQFDSSQQTVLDQLRTGDLSWTAAEERLSEEIRPYLRIVEAAYQSGLSVVGMHLPSSDPCYDHISNAELYGRFQWRLFEERLAGSPVADPRMAFRYASNCYAVIILESIYAAGTARVAVYGGANHYMYSPIPLYHETTLNYLVHTLLGLSGVVVYLTPNQRSALLPFGYKSPLMLSLPEAAREMGLRGERFMVDTPRDRVADDRPDFVVHVG